MHHLSATHNNWHVTWLWSYYRTKKKKKDYIYTMALIIKQIQDWYPFIVHHFSATHNNWHVTWLWSYYKKKRGYIYIMALIIKKIKNTDTRLLCITFLQHTIIDTWHGCDHICRQLCGKRVKLETRKITWHHGCDTLVIYSCFNRAEQNRNFICKDVYIYTSSYKTFNPTIYTWHSIIINI